MRLAIIASCRITQGASAEEFLTTRKDGVFEASSAMVLVSGIGGYSSGGNIGA